MRRTTALFTLLLTACGGAEPPAEAPPEETEAEAPDGEDGEGAHEQADDGHEEEAAEVDHAAGHPGGRPHDGHGAHHGFADVERFAAMFDAPERAAWQRPERVVELLAIEPGQTVVDLGAGTGYFLALLDAAVGEGGRVLALDVEPNMVEHMTTRVAREALGRTEARVCPMDSTGLEAASVDRLLIVDTWHHLAERGAYSAHLREVLRPGGSVLVVDFTMDSPQGPPRTMRLTAAQVVAELEAGGLRATVVEEDLPFQYVVRATASPTPSVTP